MFIIYYCYYYLIFFYSPVLVLLPVSSMNAPHSIPSPSSPRGCLHHGRFCFIEIKDDTFDLLVDLILPNLCLQKKKKNCGKQDSGEVRFPTLHNCCVPPHSLIYSVLQERGTWTYRVYMKLNFLPFMHSCAYKTLPRGTWSTLRDNYNSYSPINCRLSAPQRKCRKLLYRISLGNKIALIGLI